MILSEWSLSDVTEGTQCLSQVSEIIPRCFVRSSWTGSLVFVPLQTCGRQNQVSVLSGSKTRQSFQEAVSTGLIYDLCIECPLQSFWMLEWLWDLCYFFFPSLPKQKSVYSTSEELHQLWVKRYLFELRRMCRFMRVGAGVRVTGGWLILTQGWQFSCCADVFRHTCAGDWRAFKVVTFLLWKYPFSCETGLSAAICQEGRETACAIQLEHLKQQQAEPRPLKLGFLHQSNVSHCYLLESQTLLGGRFSYTFVIKKKNAPQNRRTAGCP